MEEQTKVGGIRLPLSYWEKLRALMQHHGGRGWLEKLIDAAYRRMMRM